MWYSEANDDIGGGAGALEIIEYFASENKEYWLSKVRECNWSAGQFLHTQLQNGTLKQLTGENTRVLMLTDGGELLAFCTFADMDDIRPTGLRPWLGWIYTFPQHRGHRYAGQLLRHAEALAKAEGVQSLHISTNHIGLYEKYGYDFLAIMKDMHGEDSRVYVKNL